MDDRNAVVVWLEGKKTYVVAITILAVGIMELCGVEVHEFVWAAIGAFGLGFLRAGVKASGQK